MWCFHGQDKYGLGVVDMGRVGYLTRYMCDNPDCEIYQMCFRGGIDEKCPVCGTSNVVVTKGGVGE